MTKRIFSALSLAISVYFYAQESKIDTVYIFDKHIQEAKRFHTISVLKTSDLEKNGNNLSEVLQFQSPIYIKENGRGMVSSPSFRGTTAQQTAFVWNGIPINSLFLGQGDINNLGLFGSDVLEIKSGGGSVLYGSGAIGGSVHFNDELSFNKGFNARLHSEIGQFETYNTTLKASFSNEKLSFKISGNHFISSNKYEIPEKNFTNWNAQYYNTSLSLGISYKLNSKNKISWQSQLLDNAQNYPTFEEYGNKTKYMSQGIRSLLAWDLTNGNLKNSLKTVFVQDEFQYFGNVNAPKTNGGTSKNLIVKNDLDYSVNSNLSFSTITELQSTTGEGYKSGIDKVERDIFSVGGLVHYRISTFNFEGGIKKDFIENLKSPLLFSFSAKWEQLKWYSLILNFSKNFRYPTFNDLYWTPGGNPNLKSEISYQTEMIHRLKYRSIEFTASPFYMNISNMIRWLPTNKGYWAAFNTNKVESYGIETSLTYHQKIGSKQNIKGNLGYSYTHSSDSETDKMLSYVPLHKVFGGIDYQYSFINIYIQGIYNGKVFTTQDEDNTQSISSYFVLNSGINFTLLKKYSLGFRVNNITNSLYSTSAFWMPKRNFSFFGTINF